MQIPMSREKPKRRPRYKGKNPRHFSEKYKEHAPECYADDVAKVIASGRTPAGTHRPVMVGEIMEVLAPQAGELAVDCTLGFGPDTFTVHRTNFAGLARVLPEPADVVFADLGVSSMQMDNPTRGFTYKYDGPLDLRMNPRRGQTASALLASLDEPALAALLIENADEPNADRMAQAILQASVSTTTQLATVIRRTGADEDCVRRVFQALRIAVNDEFGALDEFLRNLPLCLKAGGRVAILTFHSGEDRRVKKSFQSGERTGEYSEVAHEVLRATPEEVRANPRSRSAKLRWARRSATDARSPSGQFPREIS